MGTIGSLRGSNTDDVGRDMGDRGGDSTNETAAWAPLS